MEEFMDWKSLEWHREGWQEHEEALRELRRSLQSWTRSLINQLRATTFSKGAKKGDGAPGKDGVGALGPPP